MARASLSVRVLVGLACISTLEAQWPICYDYKVQDRSLCPKRNSKGGFVNNDETYPFCYHTIMWQTTSPPPDCRDTGCETSPASSCCCGADPILPSAKDPNFDQEREAQCGSATYGAWGTTGGSAGNCAACVQGFGADDGVGGKILEEYGDPEFSGGVDVQTFGHINDLDYKLPTCSSGMKNIFSKAENVVNKECDVKSFLALRKCGNCWRAICEFHNNLHWWNGKSYTCFKDLFLRRLECYASWYYKYCDCGVTIPEPSEEVWQKECRQTPFFVYDESRSPPVYPICSHASSLPPHLTRHAQLLLFATTLLSLSAADAWL